MSELQKTEPASPKPPRRRFTPEERIANREKEIALIKEKRRESVRKLIREAGDLLRTAEAQANAADMPEESKRCPDALAVLAGKARVDRPGQS